MRRLLVVLIAGFALLLAVGFGLKREMPVEDKPEDPNHLTIDIPQDHSYGGAGYGRQLDVSPDGKQVVYIGRSNDSRRLYLRTIGEAAPHALDGTEGAGEPTFSPDARYVVFYANGNLKRVALDGSPVSVIGKTNPPRGITWLDADTLVYGNVRGQLLRISISLGGEPAPLIQYMGPHLPQTAPSMLPGNKAVLFTASRGSIDRARIQVVSLKTGEERILLDEKGFAPRYVPTGHIVFARTFERELMAVRFDVEKLEIIGTPQRILDTPLSGQGTGGSTEYAFSASGVLIYRPLVEESIDNVLAEIGNLNLTQIHVQKNWFDQLKGLVP